MDDDRTTAPISGICLRPLERSTLISKVTVLKTSTTPSAIQTTEARERDAPEMNPRILELGSPKGILKSTVTKKKQPACAPLSPPKTGGKNVTFAEGDTVWEFRAGGEQDEATDEMRTSEASAIPHQSER
jgi:hypothetical protein